MMEFINANNGIALASKIKNAWTNYLYAIDDLCHTMNEEVEQ